MLAGYTPLREMMQKAIAHGVEKLAAAETSEKAEDKTTVIEPEQEKTASANDSIDFRNPEHMEKLAAALEEAGEKIAAGFMGGEKVSPVGLVENGKAVGGKQTAKKDPAASKNPPMKPPMTRPPDEGSGAASAMKTNRTEPAPAAMPKKGVFKTASNEIVSKLQEKVEKTASKDEDKEYKRLAKGHGRVSAAAIGANGAFQGALQGGRRGGNKGALVGGVAGGALGAGLGYGSGRFAHYIAGKAAPSREKKSSDESSALDFIMAKMAYGEVEKRQGGTTLDSAAESGVKLPVGDGNSDRQFIRNAPALVKMTKKDAKKTEKKQMKEVLTEPMQSAAKDSKVQDNLRNASKGGVKIAADVSKALVEKIASEGCKCSGEGTCRFCSMKAKVEEMKAGAEK